MKTRSILSGLLISSVIQDSATRYHLTGISSIRYSQGPFFAVNDPTKARVTGEKKTDCHSQMFTQFYASDIVKQPNRLKGKTKGFMIHAHCWLMLDRAGGGLWTSHTNLYKLVRICRGYWRGSDWWGISEMSRRYSLPLDVTPVNFTQSPLIVPAIQKAIALAKTAYSHPTPGLNILPQELRVFISEFLCPITDYTTNDVQNLKNMLLEFGWELPQSFWRVRLDENLFFESREYSEDPSVDWKVRLELMSLVADRSRLDFNDLANRKRVLGIVRALRDAYAEL